ncbi:helix-turn-helix transcriptional regulator [Staphylococcus pseudintermedius]|uniref:helix-turn-helix domain-containing protein n=1 Tax=Staphylococcus TaxID=1279 RepID=UPI000D1AB916|nr:helix-turn-helix transcriptional regulator [Staphylococcus capitis]EGQ1765558.1 XRE family transcriptional regulator [Staphylococcus pseudintermedius]RIO89945.1 XRE family transcriptional regulator [Staphylococcus haemolyticus]EGQ3800584.1 helix-turn-helix transcriptional regulator [Staphylococcus pseudintermedius]EGQ3868783.1 helix-turn-helix transcriptional regulator [Staphylococcus pseudintermedius]EGQ4151208.1 helix-turn-helix transcriptional regulator [Staphylococcus pseudintermedius]
MNIGDNIKKIRKEKNITQSQLARSLEISQSYLSDLENNRKNLGIKTIEKIAKKLNVSVAYLTSGNKMLGDLTDDEINEQFSELRFKLNRDNANREINLKSNLLDLIQQDLNYLDVHYFNNVYNFYELEKTEDDNLLFISVLLQMLRQHKMSGSKEAYDDIINDFDSFLKKYIGIK